MTWVYFDCRTDEIWSQTKMKLDLITYIVCTGFVLLGVTEAELCMRGGVHTGQVISPREDQI